MEIINKIIRIVDVNLIYCLIPMIVTLILTDILFKNKLPTKKALLIISWIIIIYSVVSLSNIIIGITFFPSESDFIERASGSYRIVYWILVTSATLFPLTLLNKNLSHKFWYVLFVAFLMKIGIFFEHFVIITTSMHSDNEPENWTSDSLKLWTHGIAITFLQGFLLAILLLVILKIIERNKLTYN